MVPEFTETNRNDTQIKQNYRKRPEYAETRRNDDSIRQNKLEEHQNQAD